MFGRLFISIIMLLSFGVFAEPVPTYKELEKNAHIVHKSIEIEISALSLSYDKAKVEYRMEQMKHNINLLKWQHYFSIGVFILVVVLVCTGLYLSYMQFIKDSGDYSSQSQSDEKNKPAGTVISADSKGFSIDSPVIGLIILFISFAFFYMYITEVYTLKPIVLEQSAYGDAK